MSVWNSKVILAADVDDLTGNGLSEVFTFFATC